MCSVEVLIVQTRQSIIMAPGRHSLSRVALVGNTAWKHDRRRNLASRDIHKSRMSDTSRSSIWHASSLAGSDRCDRGSLIPSLSAISNNHDLWKYTAHILDAINGISYWGGSLVSRVSRFPAAATPGRQVLAEKPVLDTPRT